MHPVLFRIGEFTVATYGLAIVVGLLSCLWLVRRLAHRRHLDPNFFFDLTFLLLLSGFIGARLFFVVLNWDFFLSDPVGVLFSRQGFVFQGGLIFALAAGIWFTRRHRIPLAETADVAAPGVALGHGFGRIGCFLAGCCFGKSAPELSEWEWLYPWLKPFLVRYPMVTDASGEHLSRMFNFAYQAQIRQGLLEPGAGATLPLFPVQLLESAGNFLICLVLLWFWRRRRFSGQIFALYLILYSLLRFGDEFLRGDLDRGLYFNGLLSTAQIICVLTLAGGISLWFSLRNRGIPSVPVAEGKANPPGRRAASGESGRK